MTFIAAVLLAAPLAVTATNVVLTNADGWADMNIRQLYQALTHNGFDTMISAPAHDMSEYHVETGAPQMVATGCQYHSCDNKSVSIGHEADNPMINYVNSYPLSSIQYGIQELSRTAFPSKRADLAIAGVNNGEIWREWTAFMPTIAQAAEAVRMGVPALAVSGAGHRRPYWAPVPHHSVVYAQLTTKLVQALVLGTEEGSPLLPENIFLSVNYPVIGRKQCREAKDVQFVLTRLYPSEEYTEDVMICDNGGRLPDEIAVVNRDHCYATVTALRAKRRRKVDSGMAYFQDQGAVYMRLHEILTCLPP